MHYGFFFSCFCFYAIALQAGVIEWVVSKKERYLTEPLCEEDKNRGFPHILRYELAKHGYELVEKGLKEAGEGDLVLWNRIGNKSTYKRIWLFKQKNIKQVFINFEPPLYEDFGLTPKIVRLFDHLFTWNDGIKKNEKVHKFYYPVKALMGLNLPTFEDRKISAMVLSDHESDGSNELYSKRRELVSFYETLSDGEFFFHLYGRKWNKKGRNLKTYQGIAVDCIETLQRYRFAFVFENWSNDVGYITEKVFCAFSAGTVPIYWGASNLSTYIPADCYIDGRKFASFQEIDDFMAVMTKEEWCAYQERIRVYLESEKGDLFSPKRVAKLVVQEILKSLEDYNSLKPICFDDVWR
jgi:hypothetical protein